jgi:L-ascorbate metabolism protein UlaG (beta-lactamase superfamily)
MADRMNYAFTLACVACGLSGAALWLGAAPPEIVQVIRQANGEVLLTAAADSGSFYRIDTSPDLQSWRSFVTVQSTGSEQLLDVAGPQHSRRFYRAVPVAGAAAFKGDHIQTTAGDAVIRAIGHASVVVQWNGKVLYSDPSGNAALFAGLPPADVIVITHAHSDHFSTTRLGNGNGVMLVDAETQIFAPTAVRSAMSNTSPLFLQTKTTALANGATATAHGMSIRAIPMYNLTNANHPLGVGNGYVVTLGGEDFYFSGDTEDIPEMRALTGIDVAFVCMSLPSNMTVDRAASAVREFRPRIVFPYHYAQSGTTFDTVRFKSLVGTDLGIEVRQRKYY